MGTKTLSIVIKSYGTIVTLNLQGPITSPITVTPEEMYSCYREGHYVTIYEGGIILDVNSGNIEMLCNKYKIDKGYYDNNIFEFRRLSDFVNQFKNVKDIADYLYNKFEFMNIDSEKRLDNHILAETFIYLSFDTIEERDALPHPTLDQKCKVVSTKCFYNYNGRHWELIYYGDNFGGGVTPAHNHSANEVTYVNPGYSELDTVGKALDKILYVAITISGFGVSVTGIKVNGVAQTGSFGTTLEKGVVVTDYRLSWSTSKTPISQSINNGVGTVAVGVTSVTFNGKNISADTSYSLTISDGKTSPSAGTGIYFRNKRYWGISSKATLTDADIIALSNKDFGTSKSLSASVDGNGNYIYFVFPTSFGVASFKVNGLQNTAWTVTTRAFINSSGYSESYTIYRSNTVQFGTKIAIDIT